MILLLSSRVRFAVFAPSLLGLCLLAGCGPAGGTSGGQNAGKVNPRFQKLQDKAKAAGAIKS